MKTAPADFDPLNDSHIQALAYQHGRQAALANKPVEPNQYEPPHHYFKSEALDLPAHYRRGYSEAQEARQ